MMLLSSTRTPLHIFVVLILGFQLVYSGTLRLTSRSSQRVFVQRNHGFRINCSVKGDPEPSTTWLKDGLTVEPSKERRLDKNGGLYFVDGVSEVDVGKFQCRSSNTAGVILGKKVELELIYLKNISLTVSLNVPGAIARLKCNIISNQPVQYTWLKNGKILKPDLYFKLTQLQNGVLQIRDYKFSDNGNYSCRVNNSYEEITSSVVSVVLTARNETGLQIYPGNVIRSSVGSQLVIECIQFSSRRSNLSWSKVSPLSSNGSVLVTGKSVVNLVFNAVQVSDGGEYVCRGAGEREAKLLIIVQGPPSFTTLLHPSRKLDEGNELRLECEAKGNPKPTVTWYKNGQLLNGSENVILSGDTLIINNVTMADKGVYQCEAENILGSILNYLVLDVIAKPRRAISVFAYPLSSSKINVTWSSTFESNIGDIYSVHYRAVVDIPEIQHIPLNRLMFFTIEYLKPFTEYVIYVKQYHSGTRASEQSNVVTVTTDEKVPSGPPLYVKLISYIHGTLDITWLPPTLQQRNGLITGYNITYYRQGNPVKHVINTRKDVYTSTVTNLREGKYVVKVAAKTKIGCGPFSTERTKIVSAITPAKAVLSAPVISTQYVNASIVVRVNSPINKDVTGYLITYRNILEKEEQNKRVIINGRHFTQRLSDLKLNSEYVIYIRAKTIGTEFGRPAVVVIATKRQLPKRNQTENNADSIRILPPMGITCHHAQESTALVLRWQQPPFKHATRYHITYFVESRPNERKDFSTSGLNATLSGLLPGMVYEVEITSSVRDGSEKYDSQKGKPDRRCYLPEKIPDSPPSNVTCQADPPSKIMVKWQTPARPNGQITQYLIKWSDSTGNNREEVIPTFGLRNDFTKFLTNVKKDTKYTVLVYGSNSVGTTPPAQCSVDTTMVKDITTQRPVGSKEHHSSHDDDIRLGIIIGCIISLLFVLLLALFVLWSDPCGCRSHKPLRLDESNPPTRADSQTKKRISKPDTISTEISDSSSKHYQILQKYFFEEASKESDRGLGMTPKNSRLCLDTEKVPFIQKTQQNDYSADGSFDSQDSGIQGFNKLDKGSSSSTTIKETLISPQQSSSGVVETVC